MKDRGIYIPPKIWAIKELSIAERIIAAEIQKLEETELGCFASNEYFAQLLDCSRASVKKYMSHLVRSQIVKTSKKNNQRMLSIAGIKYYPTRDKGLSQAGIKDYPTQDKILSPTIYIESTSKEITSKGASSEALEIVYPFTSKEFKAAWSEWIAERRERKLKRYTPRGEQAALHNLQTISNNEEAAAIAIIQQSIAQSWQGLFPLKGEKQPSGKRQLSYDKLKAYIQE
jgi:hypothetical protein